MGTPLGPEMGTPLGPEWAPPRSLQWVSSGDGMDTGPVLALEPLARSCLDVFADLEYSL